MKRLLAPSPPDRLKYRGGGGGCYKLIKSTRPKNIPMIS